MKRFNAINYIQENHAGRMSFGDCMEFVRSEEAMLLAEARNASRAAYGRDVFKITDEDIRSRLAPEADRYAQMLLDESQSV